MLGPALTPEPSKAGKPHDGAAVVRRPTIQDVAKRAGVHPATASRALNPALPGRFTEQTARKVREAVDALGYRPDPAARSLRTRRSRIVGVVIPDLTNPVLAPIVRGVEETLWAAGLACLIADTDNDEAREMAVIAEFEGRRCEGLVVATASRRSPTVERLALLPTSANSPIAIAGKTVSVPAGGPITSTGGGHPQVVAYTAP